MQAAPSAIGHNAGPQKPQAVGRAEDFGNRQFPL
jgi:hypothetical protein